MYSILLQLFTKQKKTDISTKHKTIAITNVVFIIWKRGMEKTKQFFTTGAYKVLNIR